MNTHNFGATYQEGIVSAVDPASHKVRCKIPALEDLETAWLSYLTPNAWGNWSHYSSMREVKVVAS